MTVLAIGALVIGLILLGWANSKSVSLKIKDVEASGGDSVAVSRPFRFFFNILGVAVLALGVLAGLKALGLLDFSNGNGAEPIPPAASTLAPPSELISPTASASRTALPPASVPSSSSGPNFVVNRPAPGEHVARQGGFVASGSAGNLGNSTLWMLDYDGAYTVDAQIKPQRGEWTAIDRPLGDVSDSLPFSLEIRFVVAETPQATAKLEAAVASDDPTLDRLPTGARLLASSSRTVLVTRP